MTRLLPASLQYPPTAMRRLSAPEPHRVRPAQPRPAQPQFGSEHRERGFSYDPDDHGYGKSNSSSSDPYGWGDTLSVGCHTDDYLTALRLIAMSDLADGSGGYTAEEAASALQTMYWNEDYRSQSVLRCAREILGKDPSWGPPPRPGNRPVW